MKLPHYGQLTKRWRDDYGTGSQQKSGEHKKAHVVTDASTPCTVNDRAGQFKCAVEMIELINSGPLKVVKTKRRSCTPFTTLSLSLSAVYLCKRTMQNKARLELADYEAVSESGLLVSPLPTSQICFVSVLALLSRHLVFSFLSYSQIKQLLLLWFINNL